MLWEAKPCGDWGPGALGAKYVNKDDILEVGLLDPPAIGDAM